MKIHLPEDILTALNHEETQRDSVASAREILERALIAQFRRISSGVLAAALLRGDTLDALQWWHQYLSTCESPTAYYPSLRDTDFLSFRDRVLKDVVTGNIRPLTLRDLNSLQIRIYGGFANYFEEGRINRQLTKFGSSLRLLVVGTHRQRNARSRMILDGRRDCECAVDGRFILGEIDFISVYGMVALYDFKREYSVSCHIPSQSDGFIDEGRIVLRQTTMRMKIESDIKEQSREHSSADVSDSPKKKTMRHILSIFHEKSYAGVGLNNYEEFLKKVKYSTLIHEDQHAKDLGKRISQSMNGIRSWRDGIRHDICRFTQIHRSMTELRDVFQPAFKQNISSSLWGSGVIPENVYSLDTEIDDLVSQKVLIRGDDERLWCPLYGRHVSWSLI